MIIQLTKSNYGNALHSVQCDFCSKCAPESRDMHTAVEYARDARFSTVTGGSVEDPRKWSCPQCTAKRSP
jgi:hypothetical protein